MGAGGAGMNQGLLFHLAFDEALPSVDGRHAYVALQRRHPDGKRWVEVARFATEAAADRAKTLVQDGGHAGPDELRIRSVNIPRR